MIKPKEELYFIQLERGYKRLPVLARPLWQMASSLAGQLVSQKDLEMIAKILIDRGYELKEQDSKYKIPTVSLMFGDNVIYLTIGPDYRLICHRAYTNLHVEPNGFVFLPKHHEYEKNN